MKRLSSRLIRVLMLLLLACGGLVVSDAAACEIEVKIQGVPREVYQTGDEIVFEVTVFLTHHDCPEGIQSTTFSGDGLKLLGATHWKEIAQGTWVRLIKVEVTSAENGEAAFHARRKCDEEGGHGFLSLRVPVSGDDDTSDERQ